MPELNLSSLENALKQLEDGLEEAKLNPHDELRPDFRQIILSSSVEIQK